MKKIVCYGEVLWDMLPTGKKLGGAPLNVALRAQSLGNDVKVISAIGKDNDGFDIFDIMKEHNADLAYVQVSTKFETSKVLVHLNERGSASYEIKMPCAWDDIQIRRDDLETVKDADAFIFGSLVARSETSRNTLFHLLENAKYKIFDVNLRPPHYTYGRLLLMMQQADFIKFNDCEIIEICKYFGLNSESIEDCIRFIGKKTHTANICVTLGKHGAVLYCSGRFYYNHGYKVTVADTVGAGDSFLAALISKLLNGAEPQESIDFACAVGAVVASKSGANPEISDEEVEALMQNC